MNTTLGSSSSIEIDKRAICLLDMDCFYCSVEEVEAPEYRNQPCGVSQYNPYKGGG
jgi:nucleotidyltransferase/DNA polymerase involved in DNA repair